MAVFRVTLIMQCNDKGWSESYFVGSLASDPASITPVALRLANDRAACNGKQTNITFVRIVNVNVSRSALLINLPAPIAGDPGFDSDNPETALIVKMKDVTRHYSKTTFMRGIWDVVVDKGGNYTPNFGFDIAISGFGDRLKADQWGWAGITAKKTSLLTTLVQDAGGTISGTLADGTFFTSPVGTVGPLRFSGIVTPGNLNGINPVVIKGPSSFTTLKRIAMLPWSGQGSVTLNTKTTIGIDAIFPQAISERKTGRVFGSPRGRAPARKRA